MPSRAVVLSGGGPVGIAWESGIAAGLAEAGLDLRDADFFVGTSAGSFVGAQLASQRDPAQLVAAQRARAEGGSRPAPENQAPAANLNELWQLMLKSHTAADPQAARRDLGAYALKARTLGEEEFIATFGRMPDRWPDKRYACTAVDTADGSFHVWDNDSGVGIARAIASSCAVPGVYPPITINGRRYMDGGMRSGTNADLARAYDRVLVIVVQSGRSLPGMEQMAEARERQFAAELTAIREAGGRPEVLMPDTASSDAMGLNLMDFRARGKAVEAGVAQGRSEGARLHAFWIS